MISKSDIKEILVLTIGEDCDAISHTELERNHVYISQKNSHILKIYNRHNKWLSEKSALFYLQNKPIDIEVPIVINQGIFKDNIYWLELSHINGIVAKDLLLSEPFNPLSFFEDAGQKHAKIHTLSINDFYGYWDYPHEKSSLKDSNFLEQMITENSTLLMEQKFPEHDIFVSAIKKLYEFKQKTPSYNVPVLCHNDYNPRNILVSPDGENKICGLIDFESSMFCEKEFDMVGMIFHVSDKAEWNAYIKGYEQQSNNEKVCDYKLMYYLLALCIKICSWSHDSDISYYKKSVGLIKKILMGTEIIGDLIE